MLQPGGPRGHDHLTITLNGLLLFVVLFYVYPMRFLIGLLADVMFGGGSFGQLPGNGWLVLYSLLFPAHWIHAARAERRALAAMAGERAQSEGGEGDQSGSAT